MLSYSNRCYFQQGRGNIVTSILRVYTVSHAIYRPFIYVQSCHVQINRFKLIYQRTRNILVAIIFLFQFG